MRTRARSIKVSAIRIVLYIVLHAAVSVSLPLQQQTSLKQVQRGIVLTGRKGEREKGRQAPVGASGLSP